MAKPHPSMALLLDLDERLVDNDLRLEIDRCYSYLGTPVVRPHPAGEGAPDARKAATSFSSRGWRWSLRAVA